METCAVSNTDWKAVLAELSDNQKVKNPTSALGWIFDQLLGAGYCIKQIKKTDPDLRPHPEKYRDRQVVKLLINNLKKESPGTQTEDPNAIGFMQGHYLNSAIHRVVWSLERLLLFRIENIKKDSANFWQLIKTHNKFSCIGENLRSVLIHFRDKPSKQHEQFTYYCEKPATKENILFILYVRTNRQKHWAEKASRATIGDADGHKPWDELKFSEQLKLVEYGLLLMVGSLKEVVDSLDQAPSPQILSE